MPNDETFMSNGSSFGSSVALSADGNTALIEAAIGQRETSERRGCSHARARRGRSRAEARPERRAATLERLRQQRRAVGRWQHRADRRRHRQRRLTGAAWVFVRSGSTWTQQRQAHRRRRARRRGLRHERRALVRRQHRARRRPQRTATAPGRRAGCSRARASTWSTAAARSDPAVGADGTASNFGTAVALSSGRQHRVDRRPAGQQPGTGRSGSTPGRARPARAQADRRDRPGDIAVQSAVRERRRAVVGRHHGADRRPPGRQRRRPAARPGCSPAPERRGAEQAEAPGHELTGSQRALRQQRRALSGREHRARSAPTRTTRTRRRGVPVHAVRVRPGRSAAEDLADRDANGFGSFGTGVALVVRRPDRDGRRPGDTHRDRRGVRVRTARSGLLQRLGDRPAGRRLGGRVARRARCRPAPIPPSRSWADRATGTSAASTRPPASSRTRRTRSSPARTRSRTA